MTNTSSETKKEASKHSRLLSITGITGSAGRFFVEELQKHNYRGKIRCIIHSPKSEKILKQSGLSTRIKQYRKAHQ